MNRAIAIVVATSSITVANRLTTTVFTPLEPISTSAGRFYREAHNRRHADAHPAGTYCAGMYAGSPVSLSTDDA